MQQHKTSNSNNSNNNNNKNIYIFPRSLNLRLPGCEVVAGLYFLLASLACLVHRNIFFISISVWYERSNFKLKGFYFFYFDIMGQKKRKKGTLFVCLKFLFIYNFFLVISKYLQKGNSDIFIELVDKSFKMKIRQNLCISLLLQLLIEIYNVDMKSKRYWLKCLRKRLLKARQESFYSYESAKQNFQQVSKLKVLQLQIEFILKDVGEVFAFVYFIWLSF